MEKPKIEDFEIKSRNCWGTTTYRADYYAYSQALEKYINTSEPHLPLGDVIKSVCVSCGKPVKDFDEENNNCCDECWLRAQQTVL